MEVLSVNHDPIIVVELCSLFNIQGSSFMVDTLGDIVYMVVHCSHSGQPFFCGCRAEFVVVIEVYAVWIKATETAV